MHLTQTLGSCKEFSEGTASNTSLEKLLLRLSLRIFLLRDLGTVAARISLGNVSRIFINTGRSPVVLRDDLREWLLENLEIPDSAIKNLMKRTLDNA